MGMDDTGNRAQSDSWLGGSFRGSTGIASCGSMYYPILVGTESTPYHHHITLGT